MHPSPSPLRKTPISLLYCFRKGPFVQYLIVCGIIQCSQSFPYTVRVLLFLFSVEIHWYNGVGWSRDHFLMDMFMFFLFFPHMTPIHVDLDLFEVGFFRLYFSWVVGDNLLLFSSLLLGYPMEVVHFLHIVTCRDTMISCLGLSN